MPNPGKAVTAALWLAGQFACTSEAPNGPAPPDGGDGGNGTLPWTGPYPKGPYGLDVGQVLPDIAADGYLRASSSEPAAGAMYRKWTIAELRSQTSARYAFLHYTEPH